MDTPAPVEISPVDTLLLLCRRVMGLAWGKYAANHVRKDREYTCFEMPDRSILGANCALEVVLDRAGGVWPWVMIARTREEWDALIMSDFAPADSGMCLRLAA